MNQPTMSRIEAAAEMGVSLRWVDTLRATGALSWCYEDREVRISVADVLAVQAKRVAA